MEYGCGDSFPFDFEQNGIPFGSKSKGKLSPRSYPIRFERKRKYSFLSVTCEKGSDLGKFSDDLNIFQKLSGSASKVCLDWKL